MDYNLGFTNKIKIAYEQESIYIILVYLFRATSPTSGDKYLFEYVGGNFYLYKKGGPKSMFK